MKLKHRLLSIILCICLWLVPSAKAFAIQGDGNIDGGGGHVNQGVAGYEWPTGYEGIRITIVDAGTGQQVTSPIDFTNSNVAAVSSDIFNFGKVSKLQYRNGAALNIQTQYEYFHPDTLYCTHNCGHERF